MLHKYWLYTLHKLYEQYAIPNIANENSSMEFPD